jgi:phage-related protein
MASFPAIENCSVDALLTATKNSGATWSSNNLGDGYSKLFSFGLNPVESSWSLSWEVSPADASTIDAFLQARGDDGDKFQWQPPDEQSETDWQCRSWVIEQVSHNWFRVRATFERVYELAGDLVSESLVCDPQVFAEISQTWYNIENPVLFTNTEDATFVDPFTDISYNFAARTSNNTGGYPLNSSDSHVIALNPDLSVKWRYKYSANDGYKVRPQFGHGGGIFEIDDDHIGTVHGGSDLNTSNIRFYWTKIAKEDGALVEMKCYQESDTSESGNGFEMKHVVYNKTYGTTAIIARRDSPYQALSLGIFDSTFKPFGNGVNNWHHGYAGEYVPSTGNSNYSIAGYSSKRITTSTPRCNLQDQKLQEVRLLTWIAHLLLTTGRAS